MPLQPIATTVAYLMLAGLAIYAVLQFAFSLSKGRLAILLGRGSLRNGLVAGLTLVGSLPIMALGILLADRSAEDRVERTAIRMESAVDTFVASVDQFFDKHVAGMTSSAAAISSANRFDDELMTRWLMLYHRVYDDYLTMLFADIDGNIVTATSRMTGFLQPLEELTAQNVADRAYFREALAQGKTFTSAVFEGRGFGNDPIVAISAPLRNADGNDVGVIEGSLNLGAFKEIDRQRPLMDGAEVILVDQQNRVIFATETAGYAPLQLIASEPFIDIDRRTTPHTEYFYEDPDSTASFLGVSAQTANGWRAYFRVPVANIRQQVWADYQASAGIVIFSVALAWLLAASLVSRITRSVNDMNRAIAGFQLDGSGAEIRTPLSTFREFRVLYAEMRRRAAQLQKTYRELDHSNARGDRLRTELDTVVSSREQEIAEKTEALREANERLEGLTKLDPLTGIPNRREFDSFAARAWRLARRDHQPLAVVLLDVDYFKIFNDKLGHQAGDDCLRKVAQALVAAAQRPLDLVARYGGEEFVAVLGGSGIHDALVVAERMRLAVQSLCLVHPGSTRDVVTVSCGAAAMEPRHGGTIEELVGSADEALYYAKAAGRNCVVFRKDDEFVTYDDEGMDLSETNVLSILTARPGR
jgi:diguanylate cyclase (GGDEF)-like protein